MDQDYQTITRMRKAENFYNALFRFRNLSGELIHSLTDDERRIVRFLRDGGYLNA